MDLNFNNCCKWIIMIAIFYIFLREVCGIRLESFIMQDEMASEAGVGKNEMKLPVENIQTSQGCPKTTLTPSELLPTQISEQAAAFEKAHPNGEGIHKGINYLDAGWIIGKNSLASQSLDNANLQLRADPPIQKVQVSPWLNSTIAPDLDRKPLDDVGCGINNSLPNTADQHPSKHQLGN